MTFAEKLKSIRKKAGMPQEQLAEKLGVSRQAVTKWETDDYLFESVTEYDIAEPKHYDMKFGGANAEEIRLHALACDDIELDAKTSHMVLDGVIGTVEINCNLDMNILCKSLNGAVELNQISATSRIAVPENVSFTAIKKGIGTSISFEKDGKPAEAFDTPESDNIIELNGLKSELVITVQPRTLHLL